MTRRRTSDIYAYERSDGRLTLASHDHLLARKARYRARHRKSLAMKEARRRSNTMGVDIDAVHSKKPNTWQRRCRYCPAMIHWGAGIMCRTCYTRRADFRRDLRVLAGVYSIKPSVMREWLPENLKR